MKKIAIILSFLSFAASIEAQTISISPLTQLSYCVGGGSIVNFQSTGSFNSGNVFEVQLSDSGSNFSSWTILGRSSAPSGSIPVTFTATGRYRVRIASTDPAIYSNDNGTDIYVAGPPVPNVYALEPYGFSLDIETINFGNNFVGVQDDSIHIFDQYDDSAVRHQWTFDQDANISSSTLANPTVIWASGGTKTGGVRTWNSEGCTDTVSVSLLIESCDPIIPKGTHIVTGTETGDYQSVWIKPGGVYTGGAGSAFVESGGELSVQGSSEVEQAFARRNASVVIGQNALIDIFVLDTGASVSCNSNEGCNFLHCDSLQFDYSQVESSIVENPQASNATILQSGDHLFVNDEGLPIEIRITNLLGAEVLSQQGNGSLDVDLSALPGGVYFAVIQAGNDMEVKRIAIVH